MAKLNRPIKITIIILVFLLFECSGLFSARIMDFDQSDPVLGYRPLRSFFLKNFPFNSYDHGQWLFYGESILAGRKPFVDFFMDYGPYLYWFFSIPYRFFGQNPFAIIVTLYFISPIICFGIYFLMVRELFYRKEFIFAFLVFAWLVNLHFIYYTPMFRIAFALYSFSLVSRGWQEFDPFRLGLGGLLAVFTFFISPDMGIYACGTILLGSILMTFFLRENSFKNFKKVWFPILIGMSLAIALSAPPLIYWGIFWPYLEHVFALASGASTWHGSIPLPKTIYAIVGLLLVISGTNLYLARKFPPERKEIPPILFSFLFCLIAMKTVINRSDIPHVSFWFPSFLAYGFSSVEFSLKRIDISISFSIFPFLRRHLKLFYSLSLLFFASFLYVSTHFWIPDDYRWAWVTWYRATFHSRWNNELGLMKYKDLVYDKDLGMWLKLNRYILLQETKQFLHSQTRSGGEVLCIPQSTLNPILGYKVPWGFFTPEHAFLPKYQKLLLQKLGADPPKFIVYDYGSFWALDSRDYLLQNFERFVERHYLRDRKIGNLLILRLSDRPGNEKQDPYTPVPHHIFEGTKNLRHGVKLKFYRQPIIAVDLQYILIPVPFTESLARPYLQISLFDGNRKLRRIQFLVPPSSRPSSLRVKIRPSAVVADQLEIGLPSQRYNFIFPQRAEVLSINVLKSGPGRIYDEGFLLP